MTRWIPAAVGVLLLVLGALWTLQGANVIPGSFMTGQQVWLFIGLAVAAVGVTLIVRSLRRGAASRRAEPRR